MNDKICAVDIDTLIAFMEEGQILYQNGVESIKSNLRVLTGIFSKSKIPIICFNDKHFGTKEYAHKETELSCNGGPFSLHAYGSDAEKIPETRFSHFDVTVFPSDLVLEKPINEILIKYLKLSKQIIFEKQSYDAFWSETNLGGNKNIDIILDTFGFETFYVYGVYTEYCIKAGVLGLLKRGNVWIVKDAIYPYNKKNEDLVLIEMANLGAKFTDTHSLLYTLY